MEVNDFCEMPCERCPARQLIPPLRQTIGETILRASKLQGDIRLKLTFHFIQQALSVSKERGYDPNKTELRKIAGAAQFIAQGNCPVHKAPGGVE